MFARQCRLSVLKLASSVVYGSCSCADLALCVGGGTNTHFLEQKTTPTKSVLTRLYSQVPASASAWHASVAVQPLAPPATLTSPTFSVRASAACSICRDLCRDQRGSSSCWQRCNMCSSGMQIVLALNFRHCKCAGDCRYAAQCSQNLVYKLTGHVPCIGWRPLGTA